MSWAALKRHLIAGLVVIAPVTITAVVLWWIFQSLDGLLGNFIYPAIGVDIPGLGLLLLIVVLVAVGWLAERAVGARIVTWWHTLLERFRSRGGCTPRRTASCVRSSGRKGDSSARSSSSNTRGADAGPGLPHLGRARGRARVGPRRSDRVHSDDAEPDDGISRHREP